MLLLLLFLRAAEEAADKDCDVRYTKGVMRMPCTRIVSPLWSEMRKGNGAEKG
jgi:hypothetical protein